MDPRVGQGRAKDSADLGAPAGSLPRVPGLPEQMRRSHRFAQTLKNETRAPVQAAILGSAVLRSASRSTEQDHTESARLRTLWLTGRRLAGRAARVADLSCASACPDRDRGGGLAQGCSMSASGTVHRLPAPPE